MELLDAIKDSKKPINDLVTGFNSHLACLMAVESIKLAARCAGSEDPHRPAGLAVV